MRPVTLALALLLIPVTWAGAQDTGIRPAPGVHGVSVTTPDGDTCLVRILATSTDPAEVDVPDLSEAPQLGGPVAVGQYMRMEWDKGSELRDGFSARWTGTIDVPEAGEYTLYVTSDDGARLIVDGDAVIDVWEPRPPSTSEVTLDMTAGPHEVVLEYFEGGGGAVCILEVSADGLERTTIPAEYVSADGEPGWRVEYFQGTELEGDPVQVGHIDVLAFDWGAGGPQVGDEPPGHITLEWTPVSETAIIARIGADPGTRIGTQAGGAGRFVVDDPQGVLWDEPLEDRSMVFSFDPTGDAPPTDNVRELLREAFENTVKPALPPYEPDDDGWITLFDGESKDGWHMRSPDRDNWQAHDGVLENVGHGGSDIITDWTFLDCDLHVEFSYPPGSNSGVYLQGRYEIQVEDSAGQQPHGGMCGAIYQLVWPEVNVTRPAGEWQSFDIEFTSAGIDDDGRPTPARMSVTHNDELTIDDAEVPRATGSELDRDYLLPGPIFLQGDHGPVTYRNTRIRPK